MRIISGEARGRTLFAPTGEQTRPTSDKIRGSLFNILNGCVKGAEVLDLFGGTGALALEALSRGAARAVISDSARAAIEVIRRNAANVLKDALDERALILKADYRSAISSVSGRKFDLVFLDPPYASGLLEQALTDIAAFDICRQHGIIVAESAADTVLPALPAPYRLYREYRYGKIKLTVFHRGGNED